MANDFELAVLKELGEIKSVGTATAATLTALNERLFTDGSGVIPALHLNIQEIKDERKSDAKWDRLHNILHYSITPVLFALHEIARKMGMPI
jgi:hypothetical protein